MPVYNRLTDRQQVSAVTLNDIIHVVVTGDTSQSPQGSSYFAPLSDIQAILSGSTGPSGTNGTSGSSGTSGTNGANGTNGTSGANGTNGTSGANGTNGTSGANGTNGTSGTSGDNGTSGTSGANGTNGTSGTNGSNGSNGTSGNSGSNGSNGTSGTSGDKGGDGTSGTSGTNGASGTNGTSGNSIVAPGSNNEILTSNGAGGIVAENLATFDGVTLALNKNSTSPNITLTDSGSTSNDVYIRFSPTATTATYAVGIDKSDGNAYKITYGSNTTPSTGTARLEITSGGTVSIPLTSNNGTLFLGAADQFQFYPTSTSSSFEMYNGSSMTQHTQVSQFNGFFSLFTNIGNENSSALTYILNSGLSGETIFGSQAGIPEMVLFNSGSTSNYIIGGSGLFVRYNLSVEGKVRVGTQGSGTGTANVYRDPTTGILGPISSDVRLKTNITQISGATDIISNLRGVYFNWASNEDFVISDESKQVGLIAQEVDQYFPEAVTPNGVKDYKSVKYGEMVSLLIEGFKEQNEVIKSLQSEVELLKQRLDNL
jgi:hypothetical protein